MEPRSTVMVRPLAIGRCTRRSRKFSWKFLEKNQFRSSFGRSGASEKSRATRCQNSSLLLCMATLRTSKKRFRIFFVCLGNQFLVIFAGFWRSSTIVDVKIAFLVKFCSRYIYSEIRATKHCEKTSCAPKPGLCEPPSPE